MQQNKQPCEVDPLPNQTEPLYARARPNHRRIDWSNAYFAALEANGGSFKKAAAAAKIAYSCVWERRSQDHAFARAEDAVVKRTQRILQSEAVRRAVEGTRIIRFQPKTGKVYYDKQYSDVLLLRLLEMLETGSWRRNQIIEQRNEGVYPTRAERLKALEAARALRDKPC